ncbi:MAG: hypothetical protein KDK34_21045, partial [Leptospiraceae bacterium]|nr:hypothetical protein [Leptospiraceae bacterium]
LSDTLTLAGDLTIEGSFYSYGSGSSLLPNGRVSIGPGTPSNLSDDIGDLYVGADMEIGGDVSIGGDVTIAGVIFGDDYTQIQNNLSITDDLDVRGRIFDGAAIEVDVLDNLSVSGDLTVWGGDIKGLGITNIDMGEENTNVITITGDLSVAGNATISGNLSVAGEIVGIDDTYVNETGDTMTGTLYINTPAALALDIDGDIEYTGSLKNLSPVKFQDGINITNFGGISGGQILGRDVVVALEAAVELVRSAAGRSLLVPALKFVRYTKMTPRLEVRTVKLYPVQGYFQLPLEENEHIIQVRQVKDPRFIRYVGRDGNLEKEGDYKIATPTKVSYLVAGLSSDDAITLEYSVRVDAPKASVIEHSMDESSLEISEGNGILYLEEVPLDEISEHDTAAMSPRTELRLGFATMDAYDYSADRYVVAIVTGDDHVAQYIKVNGA